MYSTICTILTVKQEKINFTDGQHAIMEKQKETGKYKIVTPLKANLGHFPPSRDFNVPIMKETLSINHEEMLKESFSPRVENVGIDPFEGI
jgi:hypothetical protein